MVAINLKDKFKNGELDLSSCGLKEIPKDINTLKHVTSLNLSNNKITSIGKVIGNLIHLNKLDLSKNQIKGLPENIGNLTNLKHLNLSHNQIATLPTTLGNLKNLKYIDLKNNHLAQKFSEVVGSCQNEAQCQQAARNILKALSSQSDSDKKKKQNLDEAKKKKNEKKTQNGHITQKQQKGSKQKSKRGKGIFGKILEKIFSLSKKIIVTILFICIPFYILSFYDETRYKAIKGQFYPVWHSGLTRVCSEDSATKIEAFLVQYGTILNNTIVSCAKIMLSKSKQFYVYLTTDETILNYVNNAKTTIGDFWSKISNSGGTEQKS